MRRSWLLVSVFLAFPHVGEGQQSEGRCEVVESVTGAVKDQRSFVYGIMLNNTPQAIDIEYSHRLAVKDLATVMQGQLPVGEKGTGRPLVAVLCNKGRRENDPVTQRMAKELIHRYHASAIVVLSNGQSLSVQKAIAASYRSVLLICAQCTVGAREFVKETGDTALVFQAITPKTFFTPVVYKKLPDLEALARKLPRFDGSKTIRIVLIDSDYDGFVSIGADADRDLVINGARASAQKGTNYLRVTYKNPQTNSQFDPQQAGASAAAFRPHIVLGAGSLELAQIYNALEQRLDPGAPKPLYNRPSSR